MLFFAYHIVWPQGWAGGIDTISLLLMLAAGIALFHFRLGAIPLVAACTAVGLANIRMMG